MGWTKFEDGGFKQYRGGIFHKMERDKNPLPTILTDQMAGEMSRESIWLFLLFLLLLLLFIYYLSFFPLLSITLRGKLNLPFKYKYVMSHDHSR